MEELRPNHQVFASAYQDAPELMEEYYIIKLELMLHPEDRVIARTYCGTLDAIGNLIEKLDEDEWTRNFYASTLAAWEEWQKGDREALHQIGRSVVPLLTPAKEVCCSAYLLDEAEWDYTDKYGCTMLAYANSVDVHETLVYSEYRYLRFARYKFSGLSRVHSDKGWVDYHIDDGGVPGMIYEDDDGKVNSWLYVFVDDFDSYRNGVAVMRDDKCIDYGRISADLFVR